MGFLKRTGTPGGSPWAEALSTTRTRPPAAEGRGRDADRRRENCRVDSAVEVPGRQVTPTGGRGA
ncbi:hypothetical protein E4K10_34665 [Streptomyces sp. T1317-0309]|nr:hypothetical protein E4K10_34665 [Streptomyces sp. T1317-0309]